MSVNVFDHDTIYPLAKYGLVSEFWGVNLDTLTDTWIAMGALIAVAVLARIAAEKYKNDYAGVIIRMMYGYFSKSIEEAVGFFDREVFNFIAGIFTFVLFCNVVGSFIPGVGEPTTDVNTTFAVGLSSFFFVQYQGIKYKGWGYFTKFFSPVFLLFPLNVIGQLAKIASLTFRLFGNMLGDAIIWGLLVNALGFVSFIYVPLVVLSFVTLFFFEKYKIAKKGPRWNKLSWVLFIFVSLIPGIQLLFGVATGILQAFVVAVLTTFYISSERSSEGGH